MSILLEALRKSEKSQRAHEVPTIHADDEATTTPESLATGPLAMLLVLALFMSGWFVWHQYRPVDSSVQPALAGTQQPAVATQDAVANTQPVTVRPQSSGSGVNDESPIVTPPETSDAKTAQVKSSKTIADESTGKQRTPMESYKAPAKSAPNTRPTDAERVAATPPPANTADSGNNQFTSAGATVKEPAAVTRPEPRPEVPRPMGYWELPDSVRDNVPEIRFSVLVYATNPSDRFVLIDGERLLEGDTAGIDLVVKEIRRDGVIFSYGLYQFLVEK